MEILIDSLIVICLITTFIVLILGLFHTAKSGNDDEHNKVNLFMRYRVGIQFVTLVILTISLYLKT